MNEVHISRFPHDLVFKILKQGLAGLLPERMMNIDDDFHLPSAESRNIINEVFQRHGGDGYNENNLFQVAAYSLGEAIVGAPRHGKLPPQIHFGLIANQKANAVAAHDRKHGYAVGLNIGILDQLFGAAFHFCDGKSLEAEPIGTDWFAFGNIATSFIVEHEFAHISNGHLGLHPNRKSGAFEMRMSHDDPGSQSFSKLDIQTLEMDADACAVTRTLIWAMGVYRSPSAPGYLKPFFHGLSEEEVQVNVLRAITLALASQNQSDPSLGACLQNTHLPRSARLYHAAGILDLAVKKYFGLSISEKIGKEAYSQAFIETIAKFSDESLLNAEVIELYFGGQDAHIHKLTSNWRSQLIPQIQGSIAPIER